MPNRKADNAQQLDRALKELIQGPFQPSTSEILSEETRSLLKLVQSVHSHLKTHDPSSEFEKAAKQRVLKAIRQRRDSQSIPRRGVRQPRWVFQPSTVLIATLLAFLLLLSSTGIASADALPGESLYSIKRGIEEARLFITIQSEGDAVLLVEFADERIIEANLLADTGRAEDIKIALEAYVDLIDRLESLAIHSDEISTLTFSGMGELMGHQADQLVQLEERLGDAAPSVLDDAIEKSTHGKEVLEYKEQGGNPSDLAPGQRKKSEEEKEKNKKPKKDKPSKPDLED
jgi:hypothetical protein